MSGLLTAIIGIVCGLTMGIALSFGDIKRERGLIDCQSREMKHITFKAVEGDARAIFNRVCSSGAAI